jgi:lipoprotein-anchoring transpeptidase ErfK/SrfK
VRARLVGSFAAMFVSFALLTGCTSTEIGLPTPSGPNTDGPPKAKITAEPAVNAENVPVRTPVKITVAEGELTEATVTNSDGEAIAGSIAPDKLSWTSDEFLGFDETYTYSAKAEGTDRKEVALTGEFHTIKPTREIRATLNPIDDATVGVAMPISVKFDSAPKDRAAVQRSLEVQTSPGKVEGAWAWLSDKQLDWRPKEYWPSGTKVKVAANLYGVDYGQGAYGKADVTSEFTIGRNQVVKLHTPSHQMVVERDGKQVASYPASFGDDADPNLNTPNGTLVVMEKKDNERFDNARYGYTNIWKKWAVRFSNHGEFIHENEENRANIGSRNTSHGCANLFEADAKAYFDTAMIGDPVEVTGSRASMPRTSDISDWLYTWDEWKAMSALK